MFKLTATLETTSKTYEQEHTFKTAEEARKMEQELRATQPQGSTATYSMTRQ